MPYFKKKPRYFYTKRLPLYCICTAFLLNYITSKLLHQILGISLHYKGITSITFMIKSVKYASWQDIEKSLASWHIFMKYIFSVYLKTRITKKITIQNIFLYLNKSKYFIHFIAFYNINFRFMRYLKFQSNKNVSLSTFSLWIKNL